VTYSTAAETCDRLVSSIVDGAEYLTERLPQAKPLFAAFIRRALGMDYDWSEELYERTIAGMSETMLHEIKFTAADLGCLSVWRKHRTVYEFDAALWSELGMMTPDYVVPGGLFSKLPHSDPFIALPAGVTLPMADGLMQEITGFFVVGQAPDMGGYAQVSTHDPASTTLGLLVAGEVRHPDGDPYYSETGVRDVLWTRLTLMVDPGGTSVADLTERVRSRFRTNLSQEWESDLPVIIATCVSALVYLCTKNADLRPELGKPPARSGKRGGRTVREVPRLQVVKVGFRIGAQLRAYRRSAAGRLPAAGTGKAMPPHVRRAHLHTYRVGPGRQGFEVKWIPPVPINMSTPPKLTTVHRARARGRAGKS